MLTSRNRSSVSRYVSVALVLLAVLLLAPAVALAGPTVTVRVEGAAGTLLPATKVTLSAPEPTSSCAANSVAAAINLAVAGNWDHGEANGGGGDFTQTILGETHAFTHESDTWAEWINYHWGGGICTDLLSEGDEVLMVADHEPEPFFAPTVLPLVVSQVPASVQLGTPLTIAVSAVETPPGAFAEAGQGTPIPAVGATVSGEGLSGVAGAGGLVTLTPTRAGQLTLRATKAGDAPSTSFTVCVHNGNDGNCGTTAPVGSTPTATPGSSAAGFTTVSPYKGPFALVASASSVIDGHVYGHGPRVLSGTILAHSAVGGVSLELRRSRRGRCSAYDGVSERFRAARCGAGAFFAASSSGTFSYLLPAALAPGRYVLDIKASDAAGNHTTLARGSSRIVFYVR